MAENITDQMKTDLLNQLNSNDPDVIRAAIFIVADLGIELFIPELISCLQSPYIGVQEAAEHTLKKIRGVGVVRAVVPLLRLEDVSIRNSAIDILREIGSDDLTTLYKLLHDDDSDIRIFIADILGSSDSPTSLHMLSEALEHDPEVNVRYQACISLGNIGDVSIENVLKKALNDEEWVQFAAVEALTKLKAENSTDLLLASLENCSELLAATIINALGVIGNINAVSVLLQRLDEESGSLRNLTVKAIVEIIGARSLGLFSHKDSEKLYTYLILALDDEDEEVVQSACKGLSFIGDTKATEAIFNRISKIESNNTKLLPIAINCLARIGYNDGLKKALLSKNTYVVEAAVEVCASIGCRRSIGLLITAFDSFTVDMQRIVAHHLSILGDTSDVSFFLDLLDRYTDVYIIKEALYFIGIRTSCLTIASEILKYLHHQDQEVREAALEACLALNDDSINKELVSLFFNKDSDSRIMAVYAMAKISVDEYADTLLVALKDVCPEVRRLSIEALGMICVSRPEIFSIVAESIHDSDRNVRLALVELAGQLDTEDSLAVAIKMLNDKDSWICIRAIDSICKHNNQDFLPYIIQRLEDADLLVTLKILEVLGTIGGSIAFQVLLGFSNHEDPNVQAVVTEAINRIQEEQGERIS